MGRSFRSIEISSAARLAPARAPHRLALWLIGIALLLLPGCRGQEASADETVRVRGTVTLDGQPLSAGQILLIDNDGPFPREYLAEIREGTFEADVSPGQRRVEIRSWKQPENVSTDEGSGPFPQIIPNRYNDNSELSADLTAGEPMPLSFELSSGTN